MKIESIKFSESNLCKIIFLRSFIRNFFFLIYYKVLLINKLSVFNDDYFLLKSLKMFF